MPRRPKSLLSRADLALYRAKAGPGKGAGALFDPPWRSACSRRDSSRRTCARAVAQGEFELHYQPLVEPADGRVRAFEALLRWNHPVRGSVSPGRFRPLAEASGFIIEIGRWVLRRACRDAARWPERIRLAVNISPIQFRNTDFAADVDAGAARTAGCAPERLEIEVTEVGVPRDERRRGPSTT